MAEAIMRTPRPPHLRRRTLIDSPVVSSPLRKSMKLDDLNNSALLELVDEDQERGRRRTAVRIQQRLTNISAVSSSPSVETNVFLQQSEISNCLKMCSKLFSENRITTQNAWQLLVIDAVRKQMESCQNVSSALQVAGTSLDVGAKVYGCRVDDVYIKGLQLANALAQKDTARGDEAAEGGAEGDQNRGRRQPKRRAKKLTANKEGVLAKDDDDLFEPLKQIEPVTFSTKENVNVSPTDTLFTCRLSIDSECHQLMVGSSLSCWPKTVDQATTKSEVIPEEAADIAPISQRALCPSFLEFEIGSWSLEEEERRYAQTHIPEPVFNEGGVPLAELDGSIHDIFADEPLGPDLGEDGASDVEECHHVEQIRLQGRQLEDIVDAIPEESRIGNEYGYNTVLKTPGGAFIDKIWAGPSHWKVKYIRRSTPRFSGAQTQANVKLARKVKVATPIDFDDVENQTIDCEDKFVPKRAPPTSDYEKITLPPPSVELSEETLKRDLKYLFIADKPRRFRKKKPEKPVEENLENYDYDNPNDSLYCTRNGDVDNEDNDFDQNTMDNFQQGPLDENLVEDPEIVTAAHIQYAMQAKKMDMKKLKTILGKIVMDNAKVEKSEEGLKFSEVYSTVPHHLPVEMKRDLSVHLTVAAILHLANENDLSLRKLDGNDFVIEKATTEK